MANKKAKVTPAMPGNKSNAADLAAAIATLRHQLNLQAVATTLQL